MITLWLYLQTKTKLKEIWLKINLYVLITLRLNVHVLRIVQDTESVVHVLLIIVVWAICQDALEIWFNNLCSKYEMFWTIEIHQLTI